jgi:hypothetical protein
MINRFNQIEGRCIEKIYGQDRYGYSRSDFVDLYDLVELCQRGGYQGSELLIYDFGTGSVEKPFEKKRNVAYGNPVFIEGFLYFLQEDFDQKKIYLYKYLPKETLEKVVEFDIDEVNLYNLEIVGTPLYVISQEAGETVQCYYPEKFSLSLHDNESVIFIEDGKIYIEAWIEEGWDDDHNCATDEYRYYNRIIIKDFSGNILSEEVGCLNQAANGEWWIS